jgi:phosphohistidine swiveling domain-containing protein
MNIVGKYKVELFWEDVGETLLFAEQDDYAWKRAEQMYGYKKQHSLYIYHSGRLGAYYSERDTAKEAEVGLKFFSSSTNVREVIAIKKAVVAKVKRQIAAIRAKIRPRNVPDTVLLGIVLELIELFHEAMSAHYLTQPQFFIKFEKSEKLYRKHQKDLKALAHARFKYTRPAWTKVLHLVKQLLGGYSKQKNIPLSLLLNMSLRELGTAVFRLPEIKKRTQRFAIVSRRHNQIIYTGDIVSSLIKQYDTYKGVNYVTGIIGNRGKISGAAFVVKNEHLDLSRLPGGMKKGMVLVVQNAWPEFTKYYSLASAIVTNEGGITSHGVVVSRELGIPCIVGTRIATKIFKNGDMVEVDANTGVVRKV